VMLRRRGVMGVRDARTQGAAIYEYGRD
jgi:hypothetical protein